LEKYTFSVKPGKPQKKDKILRFGNQNTLDLSLAGPRIFWQSKNILLANSYFVLK